MEFLHECTAFVFDMDGLLFDTERLSRRALHTAADDLGVSLPEDAFLELIGRRKPDIYERLARRLGDDALTARVFELSEKHYEAFLLQGVPVKEGAAELLIWLEEQGHPCAVATSTGTAKAERKLTMAGLKKYFRAVVGGDQVEHGKPEPDIYLRAASLLRHSPEKCGVFEDSEPGLCAAHAAGTHVVWVPDLAPVVPAVQMLASARAGSLRDVLNFLQNGTA